MRAQCRSPSQAFRLARASLFNDNSRRPPLRSTQWHRQYRQPQPGLGTAERAARGSRYRSRRAQQRDWPTMRARDLQVVLHMHPGLEASYRDLLKKENKRPASHQPPWLEARAWPNLTISSIDDIYRAAATGATNEVKSYAVRQGSDATITELPSSTTRVALLAVTKKLV